MSLDTSSNTAVSTTASEAITPVSPPVQAEAVSPPAPAPVVDVTVETAPVVTTETPAPPAAAETLLGDTAPVVADTTTDSAAAPEAAATETEASQTDEPATPPSYEPFSLPDGTQTVDNEKLGQFTEILGKFKAPQELGQELVNMYVAEVKDTLARVEQIQTEFWDKQKLTWKESFESDPEIGGNRKDTTVNAAREFITTYGGSPEQQTEIRQMMETSGLGNHPAMIRLLSAANLALSEGKPLPARSPAAQPKSKIQTLYGK